MEDISRYKAQNKSREERRKKSLTEIANAVRKTLEEMGATVYQVNELYKIGPIQLIGKTRVCLPKEHRE